jgi:hypothetical protein
MTTAIEKELHSYIDKLNAVQKKSLLGFIKTIFANKEKETISIEEYNKELDEADAAIERGEYYSNEEVFEITKKMISDRKKSQVV